MRPLDAHRLLTCLVAEVIGIAVACLLIPGGTVSAHTELEFTFPAEGTTVGQPVTEISIGFTDVVALVGNGFEVIDPQGNLVVPFAVTDDDKVFRLQLDPPLAGGPVVVTYHVLSLDGHDMQGQVTFTAAAEPPPPTTTPPTDPPTTPAPTTSTATVTPVTPVPGTTATPPTTPTTADSTTPATSVDADDGDGDGDGSDSDRTLLLAALAAVVIGAGAFLVIRSRRPS